jgi:hypothetical protein
MGIALRQCGNEMEWRHILACNPEFARMLPHEYFPVGTVLNLPPHPAAASRVEQPEKSPAPEGGSEARGRWIQANCPTGDIIESPSPSNNREFPTSMSEKDCEHRIALAPSQLAAAKPAQADAREGLTATQLATIRLGLTAAKSFIANGIELGFVRMPDADCPDPAHNTPKLIDDALALLAADPGQPEPSAEVTDAARDVLCERRRQVEQEGWTPEHDEKHRDHELSCAAGCYAMHTLAYPAGDPPPAWPWGADWWKPTTHRRNLVKAGALILAEIEKIDRAAARSGDAS